jgi:hypothetical protein
MLLECFTSVISATEEFLTGVNSTGLPALMTPLSSEPLKDVEPLWCWTYQMLNLSDAQPLRCQTSKMWNLSDAKPLRCETSQMPNLSDTKSTRYWTYQILGLSYYTKQFPHPPGNPEMAATPPPAPSTPSGEIGDKTANAAPFSSLLPSRDWEPTPPTLSWISNKLVVNKFDIK